MSRWVILEQRTQFESRDNASSPKTDFSKEDRDFQSPNFVVGYRHVPVNSIKATATRLGNAHIDKALLSKLLFIST